MIKRNLSNKDAVKLITKFCLNQIKELITDTQSMEIHVIKEDVYRITLQLTYLVDMSMYLNDTNHELNESDIDTMDELLSKLHDKLVSLLTREKFDYVRYNGMLTVQRIIQLSALVNKIVIVRTVLYDTVRFTYYKEFEENMSYFEFN